MNLTIEESTTEQVSPTLYDIINRIQSQSNSTDSLQKDFLFVLILVLMAENGFLPLINDSEVIEAVKTIGVAELAKWKSPTGHMTAVFVMIGFENISSLKLLMSSLGPTAIVNVVISELDSETYSVCLPVSRYVVSPQASTIPMIFRDLKHLSITFKNKVLSPVKGRILSCCGYTNANLQGLPVEVLCKMMIYLPICDVLNVSETCKRLNCLTASECIWHELVKRDFTYVVQSDATEWKELYKHAYTQKQNRASRISRHLYAGSLHDDMEYSDYISYMDNPMWDVIQDFVQ